MALTFLVEPFLQAVIDEYGRLVLMPTNINATIARSTRFDGGTRSVDLESSGSPQVDTTPDYAVSAAFYSGLNGFMQNITFHCASGNCTWPDFASLAVCSSCHDVSIHLKEVDGIQVYKKEVQTSGGGTLTYRSDLDQPSSYTAATQDLTVRPRGYETPPFTPIIQPATLDSSGYTLDDLDLTLANYKEPLRSWHSSAGRQGNLFEAQVTADRNQTINFRQSETLLAAFTMIRGSDEYIHGNATWPDGGATATECGLTLCLNVFRSAVRGGILNESIIASASSKVPNSWLPRPASEQAASGISDLPTNPGTLESNPVYHKAFLYRDDYQLDVSVLNRSDLSGPFNLSQTALISTTDFFRKLIDDSSISIITSPTANFLHYGSPFLQPLYESRNLSKTFDSLAMSFTNMFRNNGSGLRGGTSQQWVIHYRVRWAYLTLPISLLIGKSKIKLVRRICY